MLDHDRGEGIASFPPGPVVQHALPVGDELARAHERLLARQVVTEDGPHPPAELIAIAATPAPASSSPAVPPACPKHRSAAVIQGQPRSVRVPSKL